MERQAVAGSETIWCGLSVAARRSACEEESLVLKQSAVDLQPMASQTRHVGVQLKRYRLNTNLSKIDSANYMSISCTFEWTVIYCPIVNRAEKLNFNF